VTSIRWPLRERLINGLDFEEKAPGLKEADSLRVQNGGTTRERKTHDEPRRMKNGN